MGCESKNEIALDKSLQQMSGSGKRMQRTENIEIKDENGTMVSVTATYLNPQESLRDEKEKLPEKFIVGLYQADDAGMGGLINSEQNLTINLDYPETDRDLSRAERKKRAKGIERLPLRIEPLSLEDPRLKNIPMVNRWSSYYYVEFPHTKKENFVLTYQNKIYGKKPIKKKKKKEKKVDTSKKEDQQKKHEKSGSEKREKEKKSDTASMKKEKKEVQEYKKYKMHFTKKYKYLHGKVKLFGM